MNDTLEHAQLPESALETFLGHHAFEEIADGQQQLGIWLVGGTRWHIELDDEGNVADPIVMINEDSGQRICVDVHVAVWEDRSGRGQDRTVAKINGQDR